MNFRLQPIDGLSNTLIEFGFTVSETNVKIVKLVALYSPVVVKCKFSANAEIPCVDGFCRLLYANK